MILRVVQRAPEDCVYSRFAFLRSLGQALPLNVRGERVGSATLIGAIPGERGETVELVWEIDELIASFAEHPTFTPDDYIPEFAFNPERALRAAGGWREAHDD